LSKSKVKLILEDGTSIVGDSFGALTPSSGEVVFNTGMMGYPESLTDPSYRGQILVLTYPLVGNYGIPGNTIDKDNLYKYFESKEIQVKGLIVTEYSKNYSHYEAEKSLSDWLKEYVVPGITGVDTRALTQKLREKGTMLGQIVPENEKPLSKIHDPNEDNLVAEVSIEKPQIYERGPKKVVIMDTGMKNNIIRNFLKRNITVIRVPWDYDVFANNIEFDGFFISNGPGNPATITETHKIIKKALDKEIPTFGICLGNQALALAAGAKTYKLKYGHRSQNQPVINTETNKCYITSQNHGFSIKEDSLPAGWKIWFKNLNDDTIEGIKHKTLPFFSVQFHPESTPGPTDCNYLFDEFIKTL